MTLNKILKKTLTHNMIIDSQKILSLNKSNKYLISKNEYRMLCILSSRNSAIFKRHRLSRMMFRNLADSGFLSGFRRASW